MRLIKYISIFLTAVLVSCSPSESSDVIAFSNKVTPKDFPIHEDLRESRILDFNTLGNREISIIDSIAVISTSANKNAWKVVSLNSDSIIGEFVDAGNGPNELALIPLLSQSSMVKQRDATLLSVPDNISRKRHNFNLKGIISGQDNTDSIVSDSNLDQFTVYKGLKNNTVYKLSINPTNNTILRTITINGDTVKSPYIEWLNHFSVDQLEHIGQLMPTVALSPSGKRVVEIYNSYPQINLYSLDTDSAITITPNGRLIGLNSSTNQSSERMPIIYNGIRGYKNFFVINKAGENATTELCFYDWNGNPLLSLTIPRSVNSFDIDFNKSRVLAINLTDDVIVEYKINENLKDHLKK